MARINVYFPDELLKRIDAAIPRRQSRSGLLADIAERWLSEPDLAGESGNGGARSEAKDPRLHEPVASGSVPTPVGAKASVPRRPERVAQDEAWQRHLPTCRCPICKPATKRGF